jgi:hypothetical protein
MMSYLPNSRKRHFRSKREVHVQEKHKKMRGIRKDPRMKNLSNSVFIRKVFAILTCFYSHLPHVQKCFLIKKRPMLPILYVDSSRCTTWKLPKNLEKDSSVDCTTTRRIPKMKRMTTT